jgi:hypothetical protein
LGIVEGPSLDQVGPLDRGHHQGPRHRLRQGLPREGKQTTPARNKPHPHDRRSRKPAAGREVLGGRKNRMPPKERKPTWTAEGTC